MYSNCAVRLVRHRTRIVHPQTTTTFSGVRVCQLIGRRLMHNDVYVAQWVFCKIYTRQNCRLHPFHGIDLLFLHERLQGCMSVLNLLKVHQHTNYTWPFYSLRTRRHNNWNSSKRFVVSHWLVARRAQHITK